MMFRPRQLAKAPPLAIGAHAVPVAVWLPVKWEKTRDEGVPRQRLAAHRPFCAARICCFFSRPGQEPLALPQRLTADLAQALAHPPSRRIDKPLRVIANRYDSLARGPVRPMRAAIPLDLPQVWGRWMTKKTEAASTAWALKA